VTLFTASGTAAGAGNATVTATSRVSGAALLAGLGAPSFTSHVSHRAAAVLAGSVVTVLAPRVTARARAAFGGSGRSNFRPRVTHAATATLPGSAAPSFGAHSTLKAGAALAASSSFSIDHFFVNTTLAGGTLVSAQAAAQAAGHAFFSGNSNVAPTAQVLHSATAHLAGSASLIVPLYNLAGTAAGVGGAHATAALRQAVFGNAVGSGYATLGAGHKTHWANATIAGAASLSATIVRVSIMGGRTAGVGALLDGLLMLASGTATGHGSVTGAASHYIGLSGSTSGKGVLNFSEPLPMQGVGNIVAFAEIDTVPPPYCRPICGCGSCCGRREEECFECHRHHERRHHREAWWWQCRECWRMHAEHREREEHEHEWSRHPNPDGKIGEFRWNQTFGKGDLEICIHDRIGNQRGPVLIAYTMFMVSSTGILHQVGPTDRKPARADVGKFYVTGTAGENGQPGCWAVRWRYQRTYSEPIIEQLVQFRVVDAVLDCDDRDHHIHRHCKYGWDL
jgi:hypothetical protein